MKTYTMPIDERQDRSATARPACHSLRNGRFCIAAEWYEDRIRELEAKLDLIKPAADELTRLADELKLCSTVGGEWDGTEEAAREEYDRLVALAGLVR